MNPNMVDGEMLIDWILAKLPHTKRTYELIEFINDEIRHNEERERREAYVKKSLEERWNCE